MQKKHSWEVVVLGFLKKEDKVLLGQRSKGTFENLWEFPGGKIKRGETPEKALTRELKEELNLKVKVGALRLVLSCSYNNQSILLIFYQIRSWEGVFEPLCHKNLKWVSGKELYHLPILECNKRYLNEILKALDY